MTWHIIFTTDCTWRDQKSFGSHCPILHISLFREKWSAFQRSSLEDYVQFTMRHFCLLVVVTIFGAKPSQAYTIAAGSLKLNGRQHSTAAARYIATKISAKLDDMIVWFETDTSSSLKTALWAHIAEQLVSKGYTCNALPGRSPARPYYGIGLNGPRHGVHALLICTKRPVLERNHSTQPRPCCISQQKPNKAVLLQTVSVLIDGQETDLAVIGAGLDTHDAVKENQVQRLMQHVMRRKEIATSHNRRFQAILVGDLNDRIVLNDDAGFKVKWDHHNGQKVGKLSQKSQAILRHLMTTREGRRKLLSWHVAFFDGVAVGGVRLRPSTDRISRYFFFQTEWWHKSFLEPAPVTYKYTPWEQTLPEDVLEQVIRNQLNRPNHSFDEQYVVTLDELSHALRETGHSDTCLNPSNMIGLFGMADKIPKIRPFEEVEDAQAYLNYDRSHQPVYLAFGWPDSLGFLKVNRSFAPSGLETARFLEFHTDFGIRANDHALTFGRVELGAKTPEKTFLHTTGAAFLAAASLTIVARKCRR